jgi:hypothetical protein
MSAYPVHFSADYKERRSRFSVFFRLILAIPLLIVLSIYGLLAEIALVIAWFWIVFTARYPDGLFEFIAGYIRALTRITGYVALMCDDYPPFWGAPEPAYPVRLDFDGPLHPYSRAKTLFRLILAIPLLIIRWAFAVVLELVSIAAWFVIVIIGTLPRSIFDVLAYSNSYIARADSYVFLLTESYPPIQDNATDENRGELAATPPSPALAAPVEEAVQEPADDGGASTPGT